MKGIRLVSIAGIQIVMHWSLAIIVALVATSTAMGVVPSLHPAWNEEVAWAIGVGFGIGLVVSIAVHELAHALVARSVGVPVPQITLFIFGGMAQMAARPKRAGHEFAIVFAGPATSFAVAGLCLATTGWPWTEGDIDALGGIGFTLLLVGQLNLILGIFNLLPGLPLDGGRILHSVVWRITGDELRATTVAGRVGQVIGFGLVTIGALMLAGVPVPWFGRGVGGLWLVLIGWLIASIASAEIEVAKRDAAGGDEHTGEDDSSAAAA